MKKTKLLTSLSALALVISLGACETTQECEECPTCPEVTEPTDEDEAWATTPGELIDLASETMNYSVQLEFDTWESVEPMVYSDYQRLLVLDEALDEFYDPDEYDATSRSYTSLWDDENNTWVTREEEGEKWTSGEERYAELQEEFDKLYDEYENLFYDIDVTSSYAVDIFVDEDYMLAVTFELQDVTDYTEDEEAEADWEYVFDSLDMYISNGAGGCIEITYGLVQTGGNFWNPTYEYQWSAGVGSYPWMYYDYSLFSTSSVYNFDNFFDYYASGTLSGIPCTAWTISDDASLWGLEYDLAFMLGAYTYWQGDYTSYPDYMPYYYSHYLTYFMEDYQEMLMNFYYANLVFTDHTYSYIKYYEDDIWIDLYDVGATDATTEINAVIAAYNDSLVVEPEEGNDSSSNSED